jgi:lipoprotein NlpI
MGDIERAIADFDAAIRLDPKDGVAFGNRGYAHGMRTNYDQAIFDFTEAIRLNPYNSSMYLKRGLARFYSGYPAAAVQDFAAAVRLRPSDAYAVIWLHLARVRAGQDDGHELAQNAANVDRTKWPSPLVDLHLGSIEHDAIRASAISNHNSKAQRNRACEIEFYLATFDLEQGDRDEAKQHLRAAASTCPAGGIERAATYAELNALR